MSTSTDRDAAIRSSLEKPRLQSPEVIAGRLADWLARRGLGSVVDVSVPAASGASSELYFVRIAGDDGVTRARVLRIIGTNVAYPMVDPEMQYLCQLAINERSAAPIPAPIVFEPDPAILGAPFLLMEMVKGEGAPDYPSYVVQGWIHDLHDSGRRLLWNRCVEQVALVHATDLDGVDRGRMALAIPGQSAIERLVAYWRVYSDVVHKEGDYPAIARSVAILENNMPALDENPVMLWGDASLRNILFRDARPVALLDFEFSHIGPHQFDIAFFAMMDRVMAEAYAGVPRLSGFPNEQATFEFYEKITGRRVSHRDYFCRMAVTYMALANTRVYQRLAREGKLDLAEVGRNPPLLYLAAMPE